jgi:hypothetical protein
VTPAGIESGASNVKSLAITSTTFGEVAVDIAATESVLGCSLTAQPASAATARVVRARCVIMVRPVPAGSRVFFTRPVVGAEPPLDQRRTVSRPSGARAQLRTLDSGAAARPGDHLVDSQTFSAPYNGFRIDSGDRIV